MQGRSSKIATGRRRGWIVDASVAAKWYLRDEKNIEQADAVLDRHARGRVPITAPNLSRYELTNALLRAIRSGRIDEAYAQRSARRFFALRIVQPTDPDDRISLALELAYGTGISFFDAMYVALAEELALQVLTADEFLLERVGRHLPSAMVHIADVLR